MRFAPKFLAAIALVLLASACTGGIKKRINPPRASLQELAAQPNGQWRLTVRLQNFSNVPTRFASVDAKLLVGGQEAGAVVLSPGLTIGPEAADVAIVTFTPSLAAKVTVASALASGRSLRYTLNGRIVTSEPKADTAFEYESALNPAPGLNGVMR